MPNRSADRFNAVNRWRQDRMPFLSGAETRNTFLHRIAMFLPTRDARYQKIARAYDTAEEVFDGSKRDSGERYFEHLRAVALILIEYLEVQDVDIIVAALLHDIVEDKDWDVDRVHRDYGEQVALYLEYLSQPAADEFKSKTEAEYVYHSRLRVAPREVILIKLADRLHNLLTLEARPRAKQITKIEETDRYYMRRARLQLILLPELREVMALLREATTPARSRKPSNGRHR